MSRLSVELSRGGAELLALGLKDVVEAPLGELDAGREPEIAARNLAQVLEDAAQRKCAARAPDDVRMHRERDVLRPFLAALRPQLLDIGLPGLEAVMRVAVFAVAMSEQGAVAERLARQLDQQLAVLLVQIRQLLVEAVRVPDEAVLDQELNGVG